MAKRHPAGCFLLAKYKHNEVLTIKCYNKLEGRSYEDNKRVKRAVY